MIRPLTAIRSAACLAVAVVSGAGAPLSAQKPAKDAETLVPTGKTVNCVQTTLIRSTQVRDDKTIDFYMTGGRILRNTLPYACSGLGFERSFLYKVSTAQLCSVDMITVLRQGIGIPGPTCGLGTFAEMKKAPK
jgi:hypothetical protein